MSAVPVDPGEPQELSREDDKNTSEQRGDVYFGGIYWHEPDETGCNWSISNVAGSNWSESLGRLSPFAEQLRTRYDGTNPARAVSYRDCHVSIQAIVQERAGHTRFVASWLLIKGPRVRKFGATARTYASADEALAAGEALAIRDVDQACKDGWPG
jgi:hypothetical protein